MAERPIINARIKAATKTLLLAACEDRGCSQGDVVEAALQQYLTPGAKDEASVLLVPHLATMQEAMSDHNTYVVQQVTAARQGVETALHALTTKVLELETAMARLVPLLTRMVEVVEKQPQDQPKPKLASYVELYPELHPQPVAGSVPEGETPARASVWTRLFTKKASI